ncbi:hypothetical protein SYJ56_19265 [Algoriphagus sp. D3-2-R+10]|uniref:hypothetical protein n=1 Tax=Algoriphagus aurantiacus TaxID=3103948 RepID=UPI002B3A666B|nr:hypothetical protein [Algoriphagus sp. D3-2-R+10]MEB2777463.1 hypothetical protein [Algoriphagus sp. D3-2-R+10]
MISQVLIEVIIKDNIPYKILYDELGKPKVLEYGIEPSETFLLFKNSVNAMKPSDLKLMLQSFLHDSNSLEELKQKIESWYKSYMDRVSGWYKKRMKFPLFYTALLVTIFVNADLFRISKAVWNDDVLRNSLVEQAIEVTQNPDFVTQMNGKTVEEKKEFVDEIYTDLKLKNLPIGWHSQLPNEEEDFFKLISYNFSSFFEFSTILGWLLMAFSLHMGAPFWFESLVKLINIRGAGVKPN